MEPLQAARNGRAPPPTVSASPEELVGRRVGVWWEEEERYHPGTVLQFLPSKGVLVVVMDDGEREEVEWAGQAGELVLLVEEAEQQQQQQRQQQEVGDEQEVEEEEEEEKRGWAHHQGEAEGEAEARVKQEGVDAATPPPAPPPQTLPSRAGLRPRGGRARTATPPEPQLLPEQRVAGQVRGALLAEAASSAAAAAGEEGEGEGEERGEEEWFNNRQEAAQALLDASHLLEGMGSDLEGAAAAEEEEEEEGGGSLRSWAAAGASDWHEQVQQDVQRLSASPIHPALAGGGAAAARVTGGGAAATAAAAVAQPPLQQELVASGANYRVFTAWDPVPGYEIFMLLPGASLEQVRRAGCCWEGLGDTGRLEGLGCRLAGWRGWGIQAGWRGGGGGGG